MLLIWRGQRLALKPRIATGGRAVGPGRAGTQATPRRRAQSPPGALGHDSSMLSSITPINRLAVRRHPSPLPWETWGAQLPRPACAPDGPRAEPPVAESQPPVANPPTPASRIRGNKKLQIFPDR